MSCCVALVHTRTWGPTAVEYAAPVLVGVALLFLLLSLGVLGLVLILTIWIYLLFEALRIEFAVRPRN